MKTSNLIKSIAFAVSAILLGGSLNAQTLATGIFVPTAAGNNATDTVTTGSYMPYQVTGDIHMHELESLGILNPSHFTWTVTAGGTLLNSTGSGAPIATDTFVYVNWNTIGNQTITTTEVPQPVSGPAYCPGNTQPTPVVVLARPTAAWTAIVQGGGCNVAGTTVNFPVNVTGTGQFNLYYTVLYTPLTGTPVSVNDSTIAAGTYQSAAQSLNINYLIPAATYGTYTFTITGISDRISRKSFVPSQASDIPDPTTHYIVYSYPTPSTGPINHIKNL
jgi:hypothetical protein